MTSRHRPAPFVGAGIRTLLATAGLMAGAASAWAQADSPACQRVANASLVRLDAPAFALVQEMDGLRVETVKHNGKLHMRTDGQAWKPSPAPLATVRKAAQTTQQWLLRCSLDGAGGTIEGEATDIYRFEVRPPSNKTETGKVWIGRDTGRPYREESGSVRGTTRYTQLPKVGP